MTTTQTTSPVSLTELAEMAARADEHGQTVLAVVLLQIIRGARQAPSTKRYLVNAAACNLDAVESARRDRRRAPKRERWSESERSV
jgi:hypothetical protein